MPNASGLGHSCRVSSRIESVKSTSAIVMSVQCSLKHSKYWVSIGTRRHPKRIFLLATFTGLAYTVASVFIFDEPSITAHVLHCFVSVFDKARAPVKQHSWTGPRLHIGFDMSFVHELQHTRALDTTLLVPNTAEGSPDATPISIASHLGDDGSSRLA